MRRPTASGVLGQLTAAFLTISLGFFIFCIGFWDSIPHDKGLRDGCAGRMSCSKDESWGLGIMALAHERVPGDI